MNKRTVFHGLALVVIWGLVGAVNAQTGAAPAAAPDADGAAKTAQVSGALDSLLDKAGPDATLSAEDMRKAFVLAAEAGRPHVIEPLAKTFLTQTAKPSPELLKLAAENARLAGDTRTAAVRQKLYVQALTDGNEASQAAARLYDMYRELGDVRAATVFMTSHGERLRASVAARKYDSVYLEQAWQDNNLAAVAHWLTLCFGDKAPLAQEQELYWHDLDRLIEVTRRDDGTAYQAVPHMRKLAGLVRESPTRAAQLLFQAETLGFNAGARGKDDATLEKEFALVAAAAKAWFDAAPTGATLQSICLMWGDGFKGSWQDAWKRGAQGKETFFKENFARLSEADKLVVAAACSGAATPPTWLELIKAVPPSPARNQWAVLVPLVFESSDPAAYRALAPALAGIENPSAAIVRSVAAGDDYGAMLKHLAEKESWMLSADDLRQTLPSAIGGIYGKFPREYREGKEPAERAYARYVAEVLLRSPIALSVDNVHLMGPLWRDGDRARMPEYLHQLDWVPLSQAQREQTFSGIRREFGQWSDQVRRQEDEAKTSPEKKQAWDAQIALIKRIDEAFEKVTDPKVFDAGKAPSPLLERLARMTQARGMKDKAATLAAERQAYALVRDFDEKKLPFGAASFDLIVGRFGDREVWDIQCEVYADQLARLATVGSSQYGRVRPNTYGIDAEQRATLESALAKATLAMLNAGKVHPALFDTYRQWRSDNESSRAIFTKLVEGNLLQQVPEFLADSSSWNPYDRRINTTTKYQWLLAREFPWMNDKYPRDSYFDDLFAAEVARTRLVDPNFWSDSSDKARKGANAAAAVLKGFARLPFGYDGSAPVYRPEDFRTVAWRVVERADAGPRNEMLTAAEAAFGTVRFDDFALGSVRLSVIDANAPDARKQWFEQLKTVLDRAATLPRLVSMPTGALALLKQLRDADDLNDAELSLLVRMFKELTLQAGDEDAAVAAIDVVQGGLMKRGRTSDLLALAPSLCAVAGPIDPNGAYRVMKPLAERVVAFSEAGQLPLAATYSRVLLALGKGLEGGSRQKLEAIRSMALISLGDVSTSVSKGDPRYPIYKAQKAHAAGMYEEAWRGYEEAHNLLEGEMTKLDPKFVFWVAGEAIRRGETDEARNVTRLMMSAVRKGDVILPDMEDRAGLDLIYADIAKAEQQYPLAKSLYERLALNADYAPTRARTTAELRVAEVLRLTADYGGAEGKLEELRRSGDKAVQAQAALLLARVKADQSQFGAAREFVAETLQINPDMVEAKLLEGELNLKTGKLLEGTQLEISDLASAQRILVPGRSLAVGIEDRNLSLIGAASAIDVRVWTEGGDLEVFNLLPFGDSKTRFNGRIATELGPPAKGDNLLQVLGGDKVYYDFTERFRKANKLPLTGTLAPPVVVVSDSQMAVSSGAIILKEGRDEALRLEAMARQADRAGLRSAERRLDEIKPGNPINVQVIDPDRSTTTQKDSVVLTATASSGDAVEKLVLHETDPVSGVFAGELKTAAAPAAARASESTLGSDPAFAISGGEHPPWVALADNKRPKHYTVDMNDRVALKHLSILADVPGRGLTKFLVQTSMTGDRFETAGGWPEAVKPWDGSLRMTVMRFPLAADAEWQPNRPRGHTDEAMRAHEEEKLRVVSKFMELGGLGPDLPAPVELPGVLSAQIDGGFAQQVRELRLNTNDAGPESWYLLHLRGGFYVGASEERSIQASVKDAKGHVLVVDGQVVPVDRKAEKPVLTKYFEKGAHTIEFYLWATANRHQPAPSYTIEWDIPEAPYFAAIPEQNCDVAKHPEIGKKLSVTPATVTAGEGNKVFDINFAANTEARLLRLALLDFEGDAPALRKLTVHDAQDRQVLPVEADLLALRNDDVLEINPGDTITIVYEDPTPVAPANRVRSERMSATYSTASIVAYFMEMSEDRWGKPTRVYSRMRRFRPGHVVNVFIQDPDADTSAERDIVPFKVRTSSGTEMELKALESPAPGSDGQANHTGCFLGRVFPVEGAPQREGEVQLLPGDGLTITYLDRENMDKGIPWERSTFIEQAGQGSPVVRVLDAESAYLPEEKRIEQISGMDEEDAEGLRWARGGSEMDAALQGEFVPVRRTILVSGRESAADDKTAAAPVLGSASFEVTWPAITLSARSSVRFFAQSYSSRRLAGVTDPNVFDPEMPGTVPFAAGPGSDVASSPPPGYERVNWRPAKPVNPSKGAGGQSDLDLGVYMCSARLWLGEPSTMTREERAERAREEADRRVTGVKAEFTVGDVPLDVVPVRGLDDGVVLAFPYTTNAIAYEEGDLGTNWIVRHYTLFSDPFLDVMDKAYQDPLQSLYMGETAHLRVMDPAGDVSGASDRISVMVRAGNAEPVAVELMETFPHSAVFKGTMDMVIKEEVVAGARSGLVGAEYGDEIVVTYTGGSAKETLSRSFKIKMGAVGLVQSFTRSFKDQSIAVQTQFTVAEAYFELAKSHRALKQSKLADQETAQGRKLLEEAIRDFPDNEAKAQAEYLLGELSLELSYAADDEAKKRDLAADALARFSDLVLAYPDSPYAPKGQFKKALTLEKMGQVDQACEEYVKLSYKYPDNSLVAETIARLGNYFLSKGQDIQKKMDAAVTDAEKAKLRKQMVDMYKTAGDVMGRLAPRFPGHKLATKANVLAGQCYMRAGAHKQAIKAFEVVMNGDRSDGEAVAEGMYWCGVTYMEMVPPEEERYSSEQKQAAKVSALRTFTSLTWDYPDSPWAKWARGKMADGMFSRLNID